MHKHFSFFPSSSTLGIVDYSHSSSWVVVSHCGIFFAFPYWVSFCVLTFWPFFKTLSSYCWVVGSLCMFCIQAHCGVDNLQFSPTPQKIYKYISNVSNITKLLSKEEVSIYIPTNCVWECWFVSILTNIGCQSLLI